MARISFSIATALVTILATSPGRSSACLPNCSLNLSSQNTISP